MLFIRNFNGEVNVQFQPSSTEQHFFMKINNAINRLSFELDDDEEGESDDDTTLDFKYYSIPEFDSEKFQGVVNRRPPALIAGPVPAPAPT